MEPVSQVSSLELSRKLKELGVKQDSLFYWAKTGIFVPGFSKEEDYIEPDGIILYKNYDKDNPSHYSAFTASELIEMISDSFEEKQIRNNNLVILYHHLNIYKDENNLWRAELQCEQTNEFWESFYAASATNALAGLFLWLLENKFIEVPK